MSWGELQTGKPKKGGHMTADRQWTQDFLTLGQIYTLNQDLTLTPLVHDAQGDLNCKRFSNQSVTP